MDEHAEKKFAGKNEFIRSNVPKPVSIGDVLEVSIESQGGQGDGIAKKDGFILFVKGAKKGESCRAKVTDVKRTFALAEKVS
jgi:23S rRNA (uridine2552-2'-O)-methyltransferase